jgi:exosortase/archaeosortase family protein
VKKRDLLFVMLLTVATMGLYSIQYFCAHWSVYVAPALGKLSAWALALCGAEVHTTTWTWFKIGHSELTTASTVLSTPRFTLTINAECCGFISFFTLVSGAFFYSMLRLSKWRYKVRFLLFAAALAILGNVFRVVSVFVISWFLGVSNGMTYHDFSGYVVFFGEMALLFLFSDSLKRRMSMDKERAKNPRSGRVAVRLPLLVLVLSALVGVSSDSGPAVIISAAMQRLAVRLTDGVLVGPYAHFVASGIETQARAEAIAGQAGIVGSAEQTIQAQEAVISNVVLSASIDVPMVFMAPALDLSATTSNIVIRPIGMTERIDPVTGAHFLRRWYSFGELPSSAPELDSYVSCDPDVYTLLEPVTNSFPVTESIALPEGPLDCVWYDFALPEQFWGVVIRPPEFVEFGGMKPDEPFKVGGFADADLGWVGETGDYGLDVLPGVIFTAAGGVTTGWRFAEGYADNWTTNGVGTWTYQE